MKFQSKKPASGELWDKAKKTAAHRKLPFGIKIKVTNTKNSKSVKHHGFCKESGSVVAETDQTEFMPYAFVYIHFHFKTKICQGQHAGCLVTSATGPSSS